MKILDKFLIRAFIGPFIIAFFIALFVLIMQFLWLYIDEMMGKGLTIFDVSELLFYLLMGFVPQALPIGVLISTVMVMGNLAERYELSSFKSAGVSLLRVMRPLLMAVSVVAAFSFFTSEILIPWANLKFYSRFYDIRKSKPALNLEAGVFNDEFAAFTLRIGKKYGDGTQLEDVMIYGNKGFNNSLVNQTLAKKGEMLNSADRQFIVMNLYDGIRYEETTGSNGQQKSKNPFVRTKFSSWQTIFDLSEFDRKKTDEDLFKSNQKMLSSGQLFNAMDSMRRLDRNLMNEMNNQVRELLTPLRKPLVSTLPPSTGARAIHSIENTPPLSNVQLAENVVVNPPTPPPTLSSPETGGNAVANPSKKSKTTPSVSKPPKTEKEKTMAQKRAENLAADEAEREVKKNIKDIKKGEKKLLMPLDKVRKQLDSLNKTRLSSIAMSDSSDAGLTTLPPVVVKKDSFRNKALKDNFYDVVPSTAKAELLNLEQRADNSARNIRTNIENTLRQTKQNNKERGKFVYEVNMKYTAALICLVFLFIGAPMGAIIQKGGFGYPILVAIGFFVFYIISTIFCKNLKDGDIPALTPIQAAWIPVFVMIPVALLLTWRAVNDYKMSLEGTGKKLKTGLDFLIHIARKK